MGRAENKCDIGAVSVAATAEHRVSHFWRRTGRGVKWTILVLVVLLVGLRIALPHIVKYYANRKLNEIPEYSGHIDRVRMHLWRGAYEIDGVSIFKTQGHVPEPFFTTPSIDLAVETRELIHGHFVGSISMSHPQVNFVQGPTPETTQSGFNKPWGRTIASLFPFEINRFAIQDGRIHFENKFKKVPVNIYMTNLDAVATNLTNARQIVNPLPAGLIAEARTIGGGIFHIDLRMNPLDAAPTFQLDAMLTNVDLVDLNNFLEAYGKFDVARGRLQLFTSVASLHGQYKGHVKILFQNLDVFQWEKDKHKNILKVFWEAIVGTLTDVFKNQPHDQLGTDVPVSGSFDKSKVDIWAAVGSLLHNAFIRALLPRLERPVTLQNSGLQESKAAIQPEAPVKKTPPPLSQPHSQ